MTYKELYRIRAAEYQKRPYALVRWDRYAYSRLDGIMYRKKAGRGGNETYNDCLIMADTETSKAKVNDWYYDKKLRIKYVPVDNYVVAWTLSIRAFDHNIVTLYGHRPSEFITCLQRIMRHMKGHETYIYFHNLSYDWVFLRRFLLDAFGVPKKQLNVKPHYPIMIKWPCGLILRDSLILAQRGLEKWANDLQVEHRKASGKWDYEKIRTQRSHFNKDELEYIEHDTLAGVECLQATMDTLHKSIYSMPYTATGIPREDVQKLAKANRGHDRFLRMALDYAQYRRAEWVYHGGYVHGSRHYINELIRGQIEGYDFASSYPFVMLAFKYPMEKFTPLPDCSLDKILAKKEEYAFMFCLKLKRPRLSDPLYPMPALQLSKCLQAINPVVDNGRILAADYVEIMLNETDAAVIADKYTWEDCRCCAVEFAKKDYLPRWLTDYIYQLFIDKTNLKGGDPVLYSIAKAKLNSIYGLHVQKSIRPDIIEDYDTGEHVTLELQGEELYNKYVQRYTSVLPYQWGVWVTSYAFSNLFRLGACCGTWLYSDTDSCYGKDWDREAVAAYNADCRRRLRENGYGPVIRNGREYWLGVAEHDPEEDTYSEFKMQGAKRYATRNAVTGKLKITVAGVPKKSGALCLKNDLDNFRPGFIFSGKETGKHTHLYIFRPGQWKDEAGNECADSVDLVPCDYLLDRVDRVDFEWLETEETEIQIYDEDESSKGLLLQFVG